MEGGEELLDYASEDEYADKKGTSGQPGAEMNNSGYVGIHATGFKDFLLKPELNRAIADAGFEHPSEVQQECITTAINGNDILCQAKSGMGKTAVFVLAILHQFPKNPEPISAIVLCHTRELISKEFNRLGKYLKEVKCRVFYGGESIDEQKKVLKNDPPHVVVGTPGRILDLTKKELLNLKKLRYFVLDECDKMLEQLDMRSDVQQIFKETPHDKQVMMFSATLSKNIRTVCRKFMQKQLEIFIDDESKLRLYGLQQYYVNIQEHEKNRKLSDLLDALVFNQVIIFVRSISRANALNKILTECSFPSVCIHGGLRQDERIMVATDVFGRGIDIERVNIVINYDMPENSDTYLHRVNQINQRKKGWKSWEVWDQGTYDHFCVEARGEGDFG